MQVQGSKSLSQSDHRITGLHAGVHKMAEQITHIIPYEEAQGLSGAPDGLDLQL